MTPETEVIACPACRRVVRVPADWLGQTVQCPECFATFTAPRREGDRLTEAVLLTPSKPDANSAPPRPAPDRALWISALGLMLLGVVSLVSNAVTLYAIVKDRDKFEAEKKEEAAKWAETFGQDPEKVGKEHPAANWPTLMGFTIWGVVCGAASFGGGAAIALRRRYWLARVGSALAILNFAGLCCVPGGIVGIWTWMMLRTDEGRGHFR